MKTLTKCSQFTTCSISNQNLIFFEPKWWKTLLTDLSLQTFSGFHSDLQEAESEGRETECQIVSNKKPCSSLGPYLICKKSI